MDGLPASYRREHSYPQALTPADFQDEESPVQAATPSLSPRVKTLERL